MDLTDDTSQKSNAIVVVRPAVLDKLQDYSSYMTVEQHHQKSAQGTQDQTLTQSHAGSTVLSGQTNSAKESAVQLERFCTIIHLILCIYYKRESLYNTVYNFQEEAELSILIILSLRFI